MQDDLTQFRAMLLQNEALKQHALELISLSDGQILFHRGDTGDGLYTVETGKIRIFTYDPDGKEITLNVFSPGESFGEMSLVDAQPRSASAIADGPTTLLRLKREDFLQQVYTSPELTQSLVRLLSERVRYMTTYVELMGQWSRLIADANYPKISQSLEEIDFSGDRVLQAVVESVRRIVEAVREREEALQQTVYQLQIQIDQTKRRQRVEEITSTQGFQNIAQQARKQRKFRLERLQGNQNQDRETKSDS